jgi:hypothetical protein
LILQLGRVLEDVGIAILSRVFLEKRDSLVAPLNDRLKPRAGVLEERLKCKTDYLVLNEELGHGSASSDSTWDHQNWRFSNAKTIMNQQRADETPSEKRPDKDGDDRIEANKDSTSNESRVSYVGVVTHGIVRFLRNNMRRSNLLVYFLTIYISHVDVISTRDLFVSHLCCC